jgi:very-short-patch-repair endonuclease
VRDAILRREAFTVLRFWNGAVHRDIGAVMDEIVLTLERTSPVRAPAG